MSSTAYPAHVSPARRLEGAPRATALSPGYAEAVTLALAHARARLVLPTVVPIVWVSRPGAALGECWWFDNGDVEIRLNAAADMSPRTVAWTTLHEAKHVADGRHPRMSYQEAEDGANRFAFDVTERPPSTEEFYRLDWRRPSGRR
jgi:hypothetical protein